MRFGIEPRYGRLIIIDQDPSSQNDSERKILRLLFSLRFLLPTTLYETPWQTHMCVGVLSLLIIFIHYEWVLMYSISKEGTTQLSDDSIEAEKVLWWSCREVRVRVGSFSALLSFVFLLLSLAMILSHLCCYGWCGASTPSRFVDSSLSCACVLIRGSVCLLYFWWCMVCASLPHLIVRVAACTYAVLRLCIYMWELCPPSEAAIHCVIDGSTPSLLVSRTTWALFVTRNRWPW